MATCLFVFQSLWLEASISDHSTDPQYLKDRCLFVYFVLFFAYSGSYNLCESCSRESWTAACHEPEGGQWVDATVIEAEIDQN